jgi:flagellar hook protein FlgE
VTHSYGLRGGEQSANERRLTMPINNTITPTGRGVPTTTTATIAINQSLSPAINLSGWTLIGIKMPAAWTAADITLQASVNNSTWVDVYDQLGTELTIEVDASRFVIINSPDLKAIRYLKIRSGTSGTPVNQEAARIITLILRAF